MNITIFGSGYVGLVTAACLAEVGNHVVCVDVDQERIDRLNSGDVPIYEPGLDALLQRNSANGRLRFTSDAESGVAHGLFLYIAVGTPPDENGHADLRYVMQVAETIASHMDGYRIIIDKSTVPVGTAAQVTERIHRVLDARHAGTEFDVVSNPEFLKEGAAIDDFMKPDRIVIGTDDPRVTELLRALYAPFNRNRDRMVCMSVRSAELTKYAANAMLATKISFMNELSHIADHLDADIEDVRRGIGSDRRIGFSFIYPGCGYGGSCFPKDVKALTRSAMHAGYEATLIQAVETVNERQKQTLFNKIEAYFDADLRDRTIALWGLSFKPNTDDVREAPSLVLIDALLHAGARVRAYDPVAREETARALGEREGLELCDDQYTVLEDADALVVVTEWQAFRSPDFDRMIQLLAQPVIFDGRNVYDPDHLAGIGLRYECIGRPANGVSGTLRAAAGAQRETLRLGVAR